TGRTRTRVPQEPESPAALPRPLLRPSELPNPKTPGLPGRVGAREERSRRRNEGIAGRAQESGEMGWQESEPLIVPPKSGNSAREDPAEGRGGRVTDPRSGNKARTLSLSTLSTERPGIAQRGSEAVS